MSKSMVMFHVLLSCCGKY
uniref:Uncharacterized protein n=1 Tax=Arundo donax TaxID=35708 RepID=A0A0A9BYY0_ARUDO